MEATFTRASTANKQDGSQVAANIPRYESGHKGEAIMIEEGTVNLLTTNQANVETDLSGLAGYFSTSIFRDTTKFWNGVASVRADVTAALVSAEPNYAHGVFTDGSVAIDLVSANTLVVSSAYVWMPAGVAFVIGGRLYDSGGNYLTEALGDIAYVGTGAWQRVQTQPYTVAMSFRPGLQVTVGSGIIATFWVDCLQSEAKGYATSWTPDTRAFETLTIPTAGVLSAAQGTISCWVKRAGNTGDSKIFGNYPSAAAGNIVSMTYLDGAMYAEYGNGTGPLQLGLTVVPQNSWHHVAMAWSGSNIYVYINGLLVGQAANLVAAFGSTFGIGCFTNGANQLNGLIDDLRFYNRALTTAEVAEVYAQ